jgi:hypothetical protein
MIKVIKLEQFVANNHIRDEVLNEIQIYKKFIKDSLSILKMHKMLKSANHIYIGIFIYFSLRIYRNNP